MKRLKLLLSFIFITTMISAYAFGQAPAPAQRAPAIPQNDYVILIHYDLGMHCTGFDVSYCCILPPYNSILAQVVKLAKRPGQLPSLVKEEDLKKAGLVLWYEHENNTYSEGSKMLYWNVPYDVNKNGSTSDAVDSMANAEFMQLYTYGENPLGPKPEKATKKLTVGLDINIPQDHGPTGKPMSFGHLDFTGETGTIVYTLLNDGHSEIAIPLSMREYWEALGLPLTAFPDGSVGTIRRVTEEIMRPYVKAKVTLAKWEDKNHDGKVQANEITPVKHHDGRPASFFGTNPIDVPACEKCHAAPRANGSEFQLWKKEYDFWKQTFPDTTDYYAKIKSASISLLEIHDKRNGTDFLKKFNPADKTGAAINRLGGSPIKCQDCHADNVIGVLKSASNPHTQRPVSALTRAMHLKHLEKEPQPDKFGRTANCQT